MTPTGHDTHPQEPDTGNPGVTPNVIDIVEALQRSLIQGLGPAQDFQADTVEAQSILQRLDRELAVEEALTRQLMARHGI